MPSRIASSSDRRRRAVPGLLDRVAGGASSGPSRSSGTRPSASTSRSAGSAVSSSGAKTLRKRASPSEAPASSRWCEHGHARPVQPLEVEVAAVLVEGLADRDRGDSERHLASRGAQNLGRVEPGRIPAPVGDHDALARRARAARARSTPGRQRRPGAGGRARTAVRPWRRRRGRARGSDRVGGHLDPVRMSSAAVVLQQPARDLGAARARERAAGRRGGRSARARASCPAAVASAAAASPAGPAPTTTSLPPRAGGLRPRQVPLAPGARVDRARDRRARVVVRDADVAADAADDLLEPSLRPWPADPDR